MKANCLTRALDQWSENPEVFILWYNGNHVVSTERIYVISNEVEFDIIRYLPLNKYGFDHLRISFGLTPKYRRLLNEYLKQE